MEGFWAAMIVAILSLVGTIVGNVLAHNKTTAVFEVQHKHLAEKVDDNKACIQSIDGRVKVLEKDVGKLKERK